MQEPMSAPTLGTGGTPLHVVFNMTGRLAAFQKRAPAPVRSPLTVSVFLFAAIVALRLTEHTSPRIGVLLLLIGPIVIVSLAYRPLAGAGMATASVAAYVLSQQLDAGGIEAVAACTRAFTYYAIPLTIALARHDEAGRRARPDDRAAAAEADGPASLTRRERQVLSLVAAGHTNAEIAEMLVLSVRTIESHRANLRRKLGRPSGAELAGHAERWGLRPHDVTGIHTDGVPRPAPVAQGLVY
jgi:DNA-binding NarL/FixJ family response regulator